MTMRKWSKYSLNIVCCSLYLEIFLSSFVFGPYLAVRGAYSWLCAQESLLWCSGLSWDVRGWTLVGHMQNKLNPCCIITLASEALFFFMVHVFFTTLPINIFIHFCIAQELYFRSLLKWYHCKRDHFFSFSCQPLSTTIHFWPIVFTALKAVHDWHVIKWHVI